MATLEKVFEEAQALPPDERRKLRDLLDHIDEKEAVVSRSFNDRASEQRWIAEHRDEYIGQWVVIEGDRLIVHGHDARTVYEAARKAGITAPYLMRVAPRREPSMGGWL